MAAVHGLHAVLIQPERTDHVAGAPLAANAAAASWFHLAAEVVLVRFDDGAATLQELQITWCDLTASLRIIDGTKETLGLGQAEIQHVDRPISGEGWSHHTNAVRLFGGDGIGLLDQERSWLELGDGPVSHQDVGVKRRVVKGLLSVVETAAQPSG